MSCASGDTAVFFTDGITDTQDKHGKESVRSRLEELVALHANDSSQEVVDAAISAEVAGHSEARKRSTTKVCVSFECNEMAARIEGEELSQCSRQPS